MSIDPRSPRQDSPREYYESRLQELDQQLATITASTRKLSVQRGVVFFIGVGVLFAIFNELVGETLGYSLIGIIGLGFLLLVGKHERTIAKSSVVKQRRNIQRVQLARIARQWSKLTPDSFEVPDDRAVEANDLNMFGKASLFQLTSRCHTPMGIAEYGDWIMNPAKPAEVKLRQGAALALGQHLPLLEELDLRGRMLAGSDAGPQAFTDWAEGEPWLRRQSTILWLVRGLTAVIATTIAAWIVAMVIGSEALANGSFLAFCGLIVVSVFVNVFWSPKVHDIFGRVNSRSNDIDWYRKLFALVQELPNDDPWLVQLKASMGADAGEPRLLLDRLGRIMKVANLRLSPLFGVLHIGIQLVSLLDFHTLARLETWQSQHGAKVHAWFAAIGRFEAIGSVATLAHDHPTWAFPSIAERDTAIMAKAVGHPLLHAKDAVVNDVKVGPPGSFLLVTGSNMSGKSTLLRSIGVNAILAQMGAPVCAASWTMPPAITLTSMRVQDSLEDGVSFFMAELKRLKTIVDQSVEMQAGEFGLLFLLDEILQGTNSVERHIAVARVIRQLVANGAIGAVSTHDLELSSNEAIRDLCDTVHFREQISDGPDGEEMTFDYKMRDGVAPSTNALKLLEMVGLSDAS